RRKMERHGGAVSHLAAEAYCTTMLFDQAFDDREPQPCALLRRDDIMAPLSEILEHERLVLRCDTDPSIAHAKFQAAISGWANECRHGTSAWRELQRVGKQV